MEHLEGNRLPLIGDTAPAFQALTTKGTVHFPDDYQGKWVLFFSHPSDFTPVCTTEFMTIASMAEEFKALNTELLGLSVDSLYSHIAWIRRIEELSWNGIEQVLVDFPVIADLNMKVSHLYGMLQPNVSSTQAVRAVFIIDPNAVIRAIIYYPLNLGRNFDELKRIISALQKADADHCRQLAAGRRCDPPIPRYLRRSKGAGGTSRRKRIFSRLVFKLPKRKVGQHFVRKSTVYLQIFVNCLFPPAPL